MTAVSASLGVGLTVGVLAALLGGALFEPFVLIGFWGVVWGLVAGVIAFGASLRRLGRGRDVERRVGAVVEAGMFAAVAASLLGFLAAWRIPPWSLSGMWMWPIAIGAGWFAIRVLRDMRRHRASLTPKPPTRPLHPFQGPADG